MSAGHHHDADSTSGTHGTVYGQIGDVKDTECKIYANSHNTQIRPWAAAPGSAMIKFAICMSLSSCMRDLFAGACLKKHFRNLYAPLCGIFCLNSVVVARYDDLTRTKFPTNCDTHLAESLLQIHSGVHCVNINICFVDKCLKKTVTGIFIVFCMWSNWLFVICVNRNIHFGRNAILCIIMHKIYLKIHSFRNDTNSERGFPSRCLC